MMPIIIYDLVNNYLKKLNNRIEDTKVSEPFTQHNAKNAL